MKKRQKIWNFTILIFLFSILFQNTSSQEKAALIMDNVAIFYPEDFNKEKHLPSFALEKEPEEIGQLPESWKTKVQFSKSLGKSIAYINTTEDTDFYGTGEVTGPLLRNGTVRKLYNLDNFRYKAYRGTRLYQSHPWVLAIRGDGTAFGVLADNTWPQEISLCDGITFKSEATPFRVIVIERNTPQEVLHVLAKLTGKMQLPPLWSLGFQQCRWSYYPDTRVKEIADTFRIKNIPCDVIWMDIHYMDEYKVFTFSPKHFPNPKETNDYLHNKGFKSVWMINPGVKNQEGYHVYDSGSEQDVWVKSNKGENYIGKVWPGDCVFPDFTQPKTAKWWSGLYNDFMATGIDGVWNDMNEPAVFNYDAKRTMPDDNIHFGGGEIKKDIHLRYHNVYGMLMISATMTGIQKANPDKRPFVLTRSNFLGGHRYAATWTGDNVSSWEHLKMSIPMSINLGLSGQPFNGPDIGGLADNATPELFGHWIALGAFYPFSRAHSPLGSNNHEPWAFGQEIEDVSRKALERRYRLLPYIYTQFYYASITGIPIMQPAFFAEINNRDLRTEDEIFLFGPDLLVIPKWADNPYLPNGNWRTVSIAGEDSKNDPYQPELKIRPGAIIPLGKVIQNTTQYTLDTLSLYISLDSLNSAQGKLYHDAGDGYEYQKGEYSLITFKAEVNNNEIVISIINEEGKLNNSIKTIEVCIITDEGVKKDYIDYSNKFKIKF